MANYNKVFLIGNLTDDPQLKQTASGKTVGRFGVAISNGDSRPDSALQENVCFVDVVVRDKMAAACAAYLKKGKLVFIEGRLHHCRWEQGGKKRSKLAVHASLVQFLSPPTQSPTQ